MPLPHPSDEPWKWGLSIEQLNVLKAEIRERFPDVAKDWSFYDLEQKWLRGFLVGKWPYGYATFINCGLTEYQDVDYMISIRGCSSSLWMITAGFLPRLVWVCTFAIHQTSDEPDRTAGRRRPATEPLRRVIARTLKTAIL